MSDFRLFLSASGANTVAHNKRGVLVHSDVDPRLDAENAARMISMDGVSSVFLVGHGIGYLPEALRRCNVNCASVELFGDVHDLAAKINVPSTNGLLNTSLSLRTQVTALTAGTRIIIAPYVMALRHELPHDLTVYLEWLQVTVQSKQVYVPLIENNMQKNKACIADLPHFERVAFESSKIAVAAGAGPTLSMCLDVVKEWREQILLVAASGAVTILAENGITPDWIVAMEARETVVLDLLQAKQNSKVLVFPWTHPGVLQDSRLNCLLASDSDNFATGGGSSGLLAADLAAKLTSGSLILIGMDMSDRNGEYAQGGNRETANAHLSAPKFSVMRAAAGKWRRNIGERDVYHMIVPGNSEVPGFMQLFPVEFPVALARSQRSFMAVGESKE